MCVRFLECEGRRENRRTEPKNDFLHANLFRVRRLGLVQLDKLKWNDSTTEIAAAKFYS